MKLKTAVSIALFSIVPNCGKNLPNVKLPIVKKNISASKAALKNENLSAYIDKATKITMDKFYKNNPQYRTDTIVGNPTADFLADIAKKFGSNSVHTCWRYGKKPQRYGLGVDLGGSSAYMAAKEHEKAIDTLNGKPYYLKLTDPNSPVYENNEVVLGIMGLNRLYIEHPNNMEIKREFQKALKNGLPKGVSLVWDRLRRKNPKTGKEIKYRTRDWKQHGHYGMTIGKGKERSYKTMDIVVFPTKLDMYIPNFFPSDYHLHIPQNVNSIKNTLTREEEKRTLTRAFLSKKTRAYLTR